MIAFTITLISLICLVRGDVGWSEFGRYRNDVNTFPSRIRINKEDDSAKSKEQKVIMEKKSSINFIDERLEEMMDVHRVTLEFSMVMSYSLSMSVSVPSSPPNRIPTTDSSPPVSSVAPDSTPTTLGPSNSAPVQTPTDSSLRPTDPPGIPGSPITLAPIPSRPPIPSGPPRPPTDEPGPQTSPPFLIPPSIEVTTEPSISRAPTGVFARGSDCLRSNAIRLANASDASATPISLEIGYIAESNSISMEAFRKELETELIATAVFAIFDCNPETVGTITPFTLEIVNGTCFPTISNTTECYVMQTAFIIGMEGPVDPDIAVFKAYSAILANMNDDEYVGTVPYLLNLEFVSPLPILVPPGATPQNAAEKNVSQSPSVNPWTIGASVASIMGGFVSLMVYAKSRQSRKRRQQLVEEAAPFVNSEDEPSAI